MNYDPACSDIETYCPIGLLVKSYCTYNMCIASSVAPYALAGHRSCMSLNYRQLTCILSVQAKEKENIVGFNK